MKRVKVVLSFLLVCTTFLLSAKITEMDEMKTQIETLRMENAALREENAQMVEVERENNKLHLELKQKEENIADLETMFSNYFAGGKYTNLGYEELKKVKDIAMSTPLDLEASAALVHYVELYDLDYSLILSIIETESNFQPYLVGTSNDRGLMQIIPSTEKGLVDLYGGTIGVEYNPSRIFEPDYNLGLGISYIAHLVDVYGMDEEKVLTAYNRGDGGMASYYANYSTYSTPYSRSVIDRSTKYRELDSGE